MKRIFATFWAVCLIAGWAVAETAEPTVIEMDAADGKSEGQSVTVVVRPVRENMPMGAAFAGVGRNGEIEKAFGMYLANMRPQVGAVSKEQAAEAVESEGNVPATIVKIQVTAKQHEEVAAIVAKWSAIETHVDTPGDVALNFAQEVLDVLGMKRPYRSGLTPANPVQYYSDIPAFNRKMVIGE